MEKMYYFHWALMPLTSASKCYSSPHSATILEQVQGTFWKKWVPGIASHNKASLSPRNCSSWMSTKEKHHSPPAVLASSSISSADFGVTPPTSQMAEGMFLTPFSQASFPVVFVFFLNLLPSHSGIILCSWQLLHTKENTKENFWKDEGPDEHLCHEPEGLGKSQSHTLCVSSWQQQGCKYYTRYLQLWVWVPSPWNRVANPHSIKLFTWKYWWKCSKKKFGVNLTSKFPSKSLGWVTKTSVNSHAIAITK